MKTLTYFIFILLFTSQSSLYAGKQPGYAIISGNADFLKEGDSASLYLYQFGEFNYCTLSQSKYTSVIRDHHFQFKIPLGDHPHYTDLVLSRVISQNLLSYLVSAGDSTQINYKNNRFSFQGKGATAWAARYQLLAIDHSFGNKYNWTASCMGKNCAFMDSSVCYQMAYLNTVQQGIDKEKLLVMKADIVGNEELYKYAMVKYLFGVAKDSLSQLLSALSTYKDRVSKLYAFDTHPFVQYSNFYAAGLIAKYRLDSCWFNNQPFDLHKAYTYLQQQYQGALRERILTYLLFQERKNKMDVTLINHTLDRVRDKNFRMVLESLKSSRIKGAEAYNFRLTDSSGTKYSMQDFANNVVLLDFWFTGCGSCRRILPALTAVEESFKGQPVKFITVSIDKYKDQWINSLKEGKYTSAYNLNLFTEGKGDAHPVIVHYNINSFPTLILIGKDGKLLDNPVDPRVDNGKNIRELIENAL